MKAKRRFRSVFFFGLTLAFVAGVGLSQAQGPASLGVQPLENLAISATVAPKISYQGMLRNAETLQPVNGTVPMIFRLYSDSACSVQVGASINVGDIDVDNGVFQVEIPVDQRHFNGQALWLQMEADGEPFGCEEILPVPYALSLRPGAIVSDGKTSVEMNHVSDTPGITAWYGVYALAETSGFGHGVYGKSEGAYGAGVIGEAESNTGWGVYGSNSGGGYAGYFSGDVGQRAGDDGLVKAAARVRCAGGSSILRYSFNNVGSSTGLTSIDGLGKCQIDFNFNLSSRYWTATAVDTLQIVSCYSPSGTNDTLICQCIGSDGVSHDSDIMIVVY